MQQFQTFLDTYPTATAHLQWSQDSELQLHTTGKKL